MPSVRENSTVEAVAVAFTSNGRNKTNALKTVGYSDKYAEHRADCVLSNVGVKAAIARIDAKMRRKSIKSREQRQEFWTDIMDTAPNMSDRLRASELLGRSEADFTDNINDNREGLAITVNTDGPKLSKEKIA